MLRCVCLLVICVTECSSTSATCALCLYCPICPALYLQQGESTPIGLHPTAPQYPSVSVPMTTPPHTCMITPHITAIPPVSVPTILPCQHVTYQTLDPHSLVRNGFLIIHQATRFKVKIQPVQYCTFKGSQRFHFVRQCIIKAWVGRIDLKEDLLEKDFCSSGSW